MGQVIGLGFCAVVALFSFYSLSRALVGLVRS